MSVAVRFLLAGAALLASPTDDVFASGFDHKVATHIVEFTVIEPMQVETITCDGWDQRFDFQGYGSIDGVKCGATGPLAPRAGTQGGHVSASFALSSGIPLELDDCIMQAFQGSGVPDGEILTTTIDCT